MQLKHVYQSMLPTLNNNDELLELPGSSIIFIFLRLPGNSMLFLMLDLDLG